MSADWVYLATCLDAHADKFPVPSHIRNYLEPLRELGWKAVATNPPPAGRCLMWVADYDRNGGACLFGSVYVYEDDEPLAWQDRVERSYRPDGIHGSCTVTHWMPIPEGPDAH